MRSAPSAWTSSVPRRAVPTGRHCLAPATLVSTLASTTLASTALAFTAHVSTATVPILSLTPTATRCTLTSSIAATPNWQAVRPQEITSWLHAYHETAGTAERPYVESYVAIDDRPLLAEQGGEQLRGHFVHTRVSVGITDRAAQRMAVCRGPPPPPPHPPPPPTTTHPECPLCRARRLWPFGRTPVGTNRGLPAARPLPRGREGGGGPLGHWPIEPRTQWANGPNGPMAQMA